MKLTHDQMMEFQSRKDPVLPAPADMADKVVLVTGTNVGLGYETVKHFVRMDPAPKKVVMTCRDEEKGVEALKRIKEETGYERLELRILDLNSFHSIKSFAEKFNAENDRLDIFIENAAVAKKSYEVSEHGFEPTIQVNVLGTHLLAILLLPIMMETAKKYKTSPRLSIVTSDLHYVAPHFDPQLVNSESGVHAALSAKENCPPQVFVMDRYSESKVLNLFFMRELHSRLPTPSQRPTITINCISPGFAISSLRREAAGAEAEQYRQMELALGFTGEEAARHIIWGVLALREEEEKMRGAYVSVSEIREESDYVIGEEGNKAQRLIWEDTVKILDGFDAQVSGILNKYLI